MEKGNRIYKYVQKVTYSILVGLALLFTVFHTSNVFAAVVEASHKEVNELTAEESAKLQKGLPTDLKDGDRVIYVYQATGSCDLAPTPPSEPGEAVPVPTPVASTLPNTGMNTDTVATMSLAIVAVGLAGYFIYKNKKSREFLLVVLAVGTGVFVAHNVSAATKTNLHEQIQARVRHAEYDLSQPQQDLECFEYIGYVKLQAPVEQPTTVETTTQSTTATVTVPEETTQSTTVPVTVPEEPTQTTTTTEEVKKGTYRRTLVLEVPEVMVKGDFMGSLAPEFKAWLAEDASRSFSAIRPYTYGKVDIKVLLNGKELSPVKVEKINEVVDNGIPAFMYTYRYEYFIEELEGEVGSSIVSPNRITFKLGDKEYSSLGDLLDDVDREANFAYDLNYGGVGTWPSGFGSSGTTSPNFEKYIEGDIEDCNYLLVDIGGANYI